MTATGILSVPGPSAAHAVDTTVPGVAHPVLIRFHEVADAIAAELAAATDRGESGQRTGQYAIDLVTDAVALPMLRDSGFRVLSEESGLSAAGAGPVVVIDPVDGSTNFSRGVPWYATALCLVDDEGPAVALVANQASGERFAAVRGEGAWRGDGSPLVPSACASTTGAIVGISGPPGGEYGWAQFRALGASALDLCLVAAGTLDAYVDMSPDAHGVWDYLAATLICAEAGAAVGDALGRDLVVLDHAARRTPIAAATPALFEALRRVRTGS
jgi:myo-inositol-1(or 4)-monophosphatase